MTDVSGEVEVAELVVLVDVSPLVPADVDDDPSDASLGGGPGGGPPGGGPSAPCEAPDPAPSCVPLVRSSRPASWDWNAVKIELNDEPLVLSTDPRSVVVVAAAVSPLVPAEAERTDDVGGGPMCAWPARGRPPAPGSSPPSGGVASDPSCDPVDELARLDSWDRKLASVDEKALPLESIREPLADVEVCDVVDPLVLAFAALFASCIC